MSPVARRPLLGLAVCWVAGVLAARWMVLPWSAWVLAAAILLLGWGLLAWVEGRVAPVALALAVVALGAGRYAWQSAPAGPDETRYLPRGGMVVAGHLLEPPTETEDGWRAAFRVGWRREGESWTPSTASVLLVGRGDPPSLGRVVQVTGRLLPPTPMRNPRDFDAAQYLAERGLDGRMSAHLVIPTGEPAPEPRLARMRQALGLRLEQALPLGEGDRARLLSSLVLGIRGAGLPEETTEQYRRAGTIHLMVVSGSQVTMLVFLFTMPLAFARRRGGPTSYPRWRVALLLLGLPLLWLYVMLADTGPSIDRALIMALLSVLAMLLGLSPWARARSFQPDMLTLWAAAAGLMLVGNPALLFSPGAQLSFGAVLGLLTVGRPITRLLQHRMPAFLALILGATLGAQLMLYPILAWHFGRLPLLAPLTNLIAVPIAGLLLPLGLLTAVCAWVWLLAGQGFAIVALWLLRVLDGTCALAARVPWAEVGWYVNTPGPVLLYYALLTGGALLLSRWADRLATDWRVPAGSEPDLW